MAQVVVHVLEIVEVEHSNCDTPLISPGLG